MSSKWDQAGDTIIEVLLAITVISTILGGAFVTANRSLQNMRQAQERGEALKLIEGQVEKLKALSVTSLGQELDGESRVFCIDEQNNIQPAYTDQRSTLPTLETDDFSRHNPACSPDQGVVYHLSIVNQANGRFHFHVRWDRIGGQGKDEVKLVYDSAIAGLPLLVVIGMDDWLLRGAS